MTIPLKPCKASARARLRPVGRSSSVALRFWSRMTMSACDGRPPFPQGCCPCPSTSGTNASCSAQVVPVARDMGSAPSRPKVESSARCRRGESSRAKHRGGRPHAARMASCSSTPSSGRPAAACGARAELAEVESGAAESTFAVSSSTSLASSDKGFRRSDDSPSSSRRHPQSPPVSPLDSPEGHVSLSLSSVIPREMTRRSGREN
mmetsp:Transcript_30524/g.98659  ORF Transcript_30524/g.98659 Transcript_30524/m.98659 type:complete len:206 (+) Transcript_30524:968-1585(+)|eukprot:scaffold19688_cov141-Isochrysis_galbana.AAC.2